MRGLSGSPNKCSGKCGEEASILLQRQPSTISSCRCDRVSLKFPSIPVSERKTVKTPALTLRVSEVREFQCPAIPVPQGQTARQSSSPPPVPTSAAFSSNSRREKNCLRNLIIPKRQSMSARLCRLSCAFILTQVIRCAFQIGLLFPVMALP